MSLYIKANDNNINEISTYDYKDEKELQRILFECPDIVYSVPELELLNSVTVLKMREFNTGYGNIDVLLITENADIIIIETKLIRNPEAIRSVVAQLVGYIKAMAEEGANKLLEAIDSGKLTKNKNFLINDKFISILSKNIEHGNIYGIIIGDDIYPNILGIIDSIQSAPHLSFHINLIKIEAYSLEQNIIFNAYNVENTKEIERSVINISIDMDNKKFAIDSQTPDNANKGTKPVQTWDEYINTVDTKYGRILTAFKEKYSSIINISMGTTGFSIGFITGQKRYALQFVYDTYLYLVSEKARKSAQVPDEIYTLYKNEIKKLPNIYDKHLISNKVSVSFDELTEESLAQILDATIIIIKEMLEINK